MLWLHECQDHWELPCHMYQSWSGNAKLGLPYHTIFYFLILILYSKKVFPFKTKFKLYHLNNIINTLPCLHHVSTVFFALFTLSNPFLALSKLKIPAQIRVHFQQFLPLATIYSQHKIFYLMYY